MLTYLDLKKKEYFETAKDYAAKHLGIRFIRGNRAYCPFHEDTQDSFRIYIHPINGVRFRCWGACEGDWDIYDLIMRLKNCSFSEAQKRFADFLGVEIEFYKKYNNKEDEITDKQEPDPPVIQTSNEELTDQHRQVMLNAAQFYQQFLPEKCQSSDKALNYLSKRGVDTITADRFMIGYCPPFNDEEYKGRAFLYHILPELDEDIRKHREYCETSLLRILEDPNSPAYLYYRNQVDFSMRLWGRYADYFAGRITFPVFDVEGRIQGIIGRRPDNRRYSWMKQAGKEGVIKTQGWLYGIDKAARGIAEYETAIVVEGIFDYFAFYNLAENPNHPIVVSCLGSRLDAAAISLLQELGAKYFIIAFDCDDAGRRGIQKAVGDIKGGGQVSYLGSMKEGEDPAVALKALSGGLSNFGIRHLQNGMQIRSPSGRPVMASFLMQRQKGKRIISEEMLVKPAEVITGKSTVEPQQNDVDTLYYIIDDLLPLLTYDHGNRAELDRKLDLIRGVLDTPIREAPDPTEGWFMLPVKFIEKETHFQLGAALILHLRLAIEQQRRKRKVKVSDLELAVWLNTSRKTVQKYKAELREAGLLNTRIKGVQQSLSVRFFCKTDDPPVPFIVE